MKSERTMVYFNGLGFIVEDVQAIAARDVNECLIYLKDRPNPLVMLINFRHLVELLRRAKLRQLDQGEQVVL